MTLDTDDRRKAVLQAMADALPTHQKGDSTSDISSSYEVIGLLVHALMSSAKFRLVGFDEDKKIETECTSLAPRLPAKWNATFGSHTFVYVHSQRKSSSGATFVIRVDRLGGKLEIRGTGSEDGGKMHRVEIAAAREIVRSAGLPLRIKIDSDSGEEDRSDLVERLQGVFVSEGALDDLLDKIQRNIIQNLLAENETGGSEELSSTTTSAPAPDVILPRSIHDPFAAVDPPACPNPYPAPDVLDQPRNIPKPVPQGEFPPPGFDDEHEIQGPLRPLNAPGSGLGGLGGVGTGHDDLNPPGLGPHDPLRQSFVPSGGFGRQTGGHHGMNPTLDQLMYPGQSNDEFGDMSGNSMFNPPGARWDPTGPGGHPRRFGGHGGGNSGGFGGGHII
ncbi:hypothetical protein TD95_003476 [Thielaviopsis punctulata]|uniref:Uncharacterized protein n=1 Tax=Thielaviopsis punctulata TaxID=72032 RepID=A0A0F4Z9V7_9PEZI|nr:hypothetical protein TD95_003476 [Thielaviopsis punctulata]